MVTAWIVLLGLLGAAVLAVCGVVDMVARVRAKVAANRALARLTIADEPLRALALQFHEGRLADRDVVAASEIISQSLSRTSLSRRALRYVRDELGEPNITHRRRYMQGLLSRA